MSDVVRSFSELTDEGQVRVGGKGRALAQLYQAGFPVPDGLAISPSAFADDALTADAWAEVRAQLKRLRATGSEVAFAVRSSAMSEDSAQASFAGEFESVLNVQSDAQILEAIDTVHRSRHNERVQAYNTSRRQFPSNITAGIFGFGEYEVFNAPPEAERVPTVNFGRQP